MNKFEVGILLSLILIAAAMLLHAVSNPPPPEDPKKILFKSIVDKMYCVIGEKNKGCFCVLGGENKVVMITSAPIELCEKHNED